MENTRKNYYVYKHIISEFNSPFYIGMGSGLRYKSTANRNNEWHKVTDENCGFNWRIIANNLSKSDALELEDLIIATYGIDNLTNMRGFEGRGHSEETKEKMRKAALGRKNPKLAELNRQRKAGKWKTHLKASEQ